MLRSIHIAALVLALAARTAAGAPGAAPAPDDEIPPPPPTYKAGGVTVEPHLGARVPLDARFRTEGGAVTTLGEVLRGELPTVLTFNYAECPQLCNLQLTGLTSALPAVAKPGPPPAGAAPGEVAFRLGGQFRLVTISLEPKESLERLAKMRERYLARLPEDQRADARRGWMLLVAEQPGVDTDIRRVAEAVGFRYVYVEDRAEWAHPAALIFLSVNGAVTRYIHGIEFDPATLRESIYKAGLAEPAAAVGFLLRCYHWDPAASDHSDVAVAALRFGAAGCVVLLIAGLGTLHMLRRARSRGAGPPSSSSSSSSHRSFDHPRSLTEEGTRS